MSTTKRKNLKVETVASRNENVFLAPIEFAFAAGNCWQVKKLVLGIEKEPHASDKEKAQALLLWERIKTDPIVTAISIVGILFFIIASWVSVN